MSGHLFCQQVHVLFSHGAVMSCLQSGRSSQTYYPHDPDFPRDLADSHTSLQSYLILMINILIFTLPFDSTVYIFNITLYFIDYVSENQVKTYSVEDSLHMLAICCSTRITCDLYCHAACAIRGPPLAYLSHCIHYCRIQFDLSGLRFAVPSAP